MPSLGATGEDVVIAEWLVNEGDFVKEGQQIFVAETDKATTEVEAFRAGYIRKILVKARESVALGDCVVIIADSLDEPIEDAVVAGPLPDRIEHVVAPVVHAVAATIAVARTSSGFSLGPPTRQGCAESIWPPLQPIGPFTNGTFSTPRPSSGTSGERPVAFSPMRRAIAVRTLQARRNNRPHFYVTARST